MSNAIVRDALVAWEPHDDVLAGVSAAWTGLMEAPFLASDSQAFMYQSQVVISYLLAERAQMINEYMGSGGEDGRTVEDVAGLSPDPAALGELNDLTTAQNIDRVFIHLYVHSHLLDYLEGRGPISAMQAIRDQIRQS